MNSDAGAETKDETIRNVWCGDANDDDGERLIVSKHNETNE